MKTNNLKEQLASLLLQIALALGASFLYAVVAMHAWNWFLAPVAPGVIQLGYAQAYGIVLFLNVAALLVTSPKVSDEESREQAESPFLHPFSKALAKCLVVLLFWGIAAIAHCAIG